MSLAEEYRDDDLDELDGENSSNDAPAETESNAESAPDSGQFSSPELESDSDYSDESDDEAGKEFAADFSILRLIFTKESFSLEKGVLEGQQINYSEIHSFDLPFILTAAIWKSEEAVERLRNIVHLECASFFPPEMRLSLIIPAEWGVIRKIEVPDQIPNEIKSEHIAWSLKLSIWEDNEAPRFNYFRSDEDTYTVACIRESLAEFGESLADSLEAKLMQISLSDLPDLNLLLPPQDEEIDDDFVVGERKSKAVIVIPIIFVLVLVLGYYLIGVKKIFQPSSAPVEMAVQDSIPAAEEPVKEEIAPQSPPVEEPQAAVTKPAPPQQQPQSVPVSGGQIPFTDVFNLFHNSADIYHLSFTGDLVRCRISSSAKNKYDVLTQKLSSSGLTSGTKKQYSSTEDSKYFTIITSTIIDGHISGYLHPEAKTVKNLLNKSGFKTDPRNSKYDIFNGSSKTVSSILKLIDKNRILLFRIRISQVAPDQYVLTLEY